MHVVWNVLHCHLGLGNINGSMMCSNMSSGWVRVHVYLTGGDDVPSLNTISDSAEPLA